MEKKYDYSGIINIVDKAFINFEEMIKSTASEKKIEDSHFNGMVTMIKFAIMGEIMSILKKGE